MLHDPQSAVQASLEAKTKAARRAEQAGFQKAEQAEHELAVARRECERAAGDAEDRKVQLSVLVETVETLQAGTPGNAIVFACLTAWEMLCKHKVQRSKDPSRPLSPMAGISLDCVNI